MNHTQDLQVQPDQVRSLYDLRYARLYNERYLTSPLTFPNTQFEITVLSSLLEGSRAWLDVACGTGYFLSHFPQYERAGIDLSDSMLEEARKANPFVTFRCADFRSTQPDWEDHWDLVSCMWYAYCLVDSVPDALSVIDNLALWTSPQGKLFLPIADPSLIAGVSLESRPTNKPWPGMVRIDGVVWSYTEACDDAEKCHRFLVAPHPDLLREHLETLFSNVSTVSYPPLPPVWPHGRLAFVASGKKSSASSRT